MVLDSKDNIVLNEPVLQADCLLTAWRHFSLATDVDVPPLVQLHISVLTGVNLSRCYIGQHTEHKQCH